MVGRRRPPTAGSRRPNRRWRSGHGAQVAIAGSEGRGPAGAQSGEGSYPQCPQDQAPLPRTSTPFYRHLFLTARGALTTTRIYLDLPPGGGPNLPLPTSIEMTPDASAVVTFHRNHWKGSPEYALEWPHRCTTDEIFVALLISGCEQWARNTSIAQSGATGTRSDPPELTGTRRRVEPPLGSHGRFHAGQGAHARARRSLHRVSSNPSQPPYPRHSRPTRLIVKSFSCVPPAEWHCFNRVAVAVGTKPVQEGAAVMDADPTDQTGVGPGLRIAPQCSQL